MVVQCSDCKYFDSNTCYGRLIDEDIAEDSEICSLFVPSTMYIKEIIGMEDDN